MKYTTIILAIILAFALIGCTQNSDETQSTTKSQQTESVQKINLNLNTGTNVGESAPRFEVTTIKGEKFALADAKKPVLVYFMATWCPHCANDFKVLSEVIDDYESGVDIIALSLDLNEDNTRLSNYISKYPKLSNMMLAQGSTDILTKYKVRTTTTKYAIDRSGKILYKGSGEFKEDQWRTLLSGLIA